MYSKDYYDSANYKPEKIGIEIFQKMSQYMPYMVFLMRASDFKLLYANRKVSEFLGFNLEDLHHMEGRIADMLVEDEIETLLDMAQKIQQIDDDKAVKMRVRLRTKEGQIMHLDTSLSVFKRDQEGFPAEYFCVSEDVTDKVLLENRTQELEIISRSAEKMFRYGAWEWFPSDDRVVWSKGIYDIFEKSPDEVGFTIEKYMEMIHPEDLENFNKVIQHATQTASDFTLEYRIISSDNNVCYIREQGKPVWNDKGELLKFIGTIRDTSDYWETLNNLKKFEITLQEAEKQMHLGTWEWDIPKGLVKWSEGFWDILEYPADQREYGWMPMEKYFQHQVSEPNNNLTAGTDRDMDPSVPREPVEITLNTYTNKTVYAVTHTRIMEWQNGEPTLAVGSTADVSNMKNIQKNLEAKVTELAKAYDEVEQFSYVASHDLQEPLRKISAFSERLKQKCGAQVDQDCALYIDRIIDGANRMRILIENLLSLSRTKRNTDYLKSTDLNEILADVLIDIETKITEQSAIIKYPKLPVIDAISTQMHQLFLNLLSNALKFTKENVPAAIDITCKTLNEKLKYEFNLDTQQEYIYIQLRDNGIGFDPVYSEMIFSPFKRLHGRSEYEGTGIGLAICKKVVQNHQGLIWAESSPGMGTTFHIVLAVHQPKEPI